MKRVLFSSRVPAICGAVINLILLDLFVPITGASKAVAQTAKAVELEQAAKREGRLRIVVFPSLTPLGEAFQKKYGIKVEGIYVGDPDILRKVSTESDAAIFETDVFATSSGPTGSKLNKWALSYTPAGYEKVAKVKEALPTDWNQIPLFNHVVGVIYHKDLVSPKQVPKSIFDLLKPEFKGKIISRTPWLGSNYLTHILSYFTWFNQDMNKWQDYWTRFKANVGRYESGFPALHFAVGLKEFSLGVFTLPYTATLWGPNYPGLAYSTFKEGGIWWPNMAAIHKNAPRPNAAKLFVNFLVSDEGQKMFADGGNIPASKDVPAKAELKQALEGIKLFNGQLQSILVREDVEKGDEWKKRIQKIFQ
ncbi:MAG: ABC transporter substrate-binding protein [Deltaproteobacteria bacterium]|nr:ABC transporter substrate-binding protein [Deltaproteobacteria bacterium]